MTKVDSTILPSTRILYRCNCCDYLAITAKECHSTNHAHTLCGFYLGDIKTRPEIKTSTILISCYTVVAIVFSPQKCSAVTPTAYRPTRLVSGVDQGVPLTSFTPPQANAHGGAPRGQGALCLHSLSPLAPAPERVREQVE